MYIYLNMCKQMTDIKVLLILDTYIAKLETI